MLQVCEKKNRVRLNAAPNWAHKLGGLVFLKSPTRGLLTKLNAIKRSKNCKEKPKK